MLRIDGLLNIQENLLDRFMIKMIPSASAALYVKAAGIVSFSIKGPRKNTFTF
jgi:hypothetical protein